ncbi:hypothetical protein LG299_13830 [Microbacterium lacus]|uniref:hypothetical protein n=1 Tax=Microbacterium lacus TaxID=415217 RepID=UPI00384E2CA6
MGGDGVDLDLEDLREVNADLGSFVTEFEGIGEASDNVQNDVGTPTGDTRLRGRVGDFESGWDGNREVILESLHNIHDHITSVIDDFIATDQSLAKGDEG